MQDKVRFELDGSVYQIQKLKPFHFLEMEGIPFDIFDTSIQSVGIHAQMQRDLEQQTDKKKADETVLRTVLETAITGFDYDVVLSLKGIDHISNLFNTVLSCSLELFDRIIKPNNQMLVNCHYLATKYGVKPSDILTDGIDKFLFNMHCLHAGLKDEAQQIKSAQKKARKR